MICPVRDSEMNYMTTYNMNVCSIIYEGYWI